MAVMDVGALISALQAQEQADALGTLVKVSRQACDEAAELLTALKAENERLRVAASPAITLLREYAEDMGGLEPSTSIILRVIANLSTALGENDNG